MRTSTETPASPAPSHLLPLPARQGTGRFAQGGRLRLTEDHRATSTRVTGPSLLPLSQLRAPVSPVNFFPDATPCSPPHTLIPGCQAAFSTSLSVLNTRELRKLLHVRPSPPPNCGPCGRPGSGSSRAPGGFRRQPRLDSPGRGVSRVAPGPAAPALPGNLPEKATLAWGGAEAEPGPRPREKG